MPGKGRLSGGIPRAFANQRTRKGYAYRAYALSTLERTGPLPHSAMPILREAGRLVVELDRLSELREHIINSKSPRRTEVRRLGAEARKTRVQLLLLERRLDELAGKNGHDLGAALAADAREATS